jgi:hypothetical protein
VDDVADISRPQTALGIVSAMIYEEQTEINDAVTDVPSGT